MLLKHRTFADCIYTAYLKTPSPARMPSSYAQNHDPAAEQATIARSWHEGSRVPPKPHPPPSGTWDASSGIIFAPSSRCDARDQTWDPSHSIVFCRGYASAPPLKFKPSVHRQPRGVASGQLDTLALIRSHQKDEERKAQARVAKPRAIKSPEKLQSAANEQNVSAVPKNVPVVVEATKVTKKLSQAEKAGAIKEANNSNPLPIKKVLEVEGQPNIDKPSVDIQNAAQVTPPLKDPSNLLTPVPKAQQPRAKASKKIQQAQIKDASILSLPETTTIPSNAATIVQQNRRVKEWRDVYQLNDRSKQRATYEGYKKLFEPVDEGIVSLVGILDSLVHSQRSKRKIYNNLLLKTRSTLQEFQATGVAMGWSPSISILLQRINANLLEQATMLESLRELKYHEEKYWNWQCTRVSRSRINFAITSHKSRGRTYAVRYQSWVSREAPGIAAADTARQAFTYMSWNVYEGAQNLRSEAEALVEWEPENPYQNPRKPLSKPVRVWVDEQKMNALGGPSFEAFLRSVKKYELLARRLHLDIVLKHRSPECRGLRVLMKEGSPGELLLNWLLQPLLQVSLNATALQTSLRSFRHAELGRPGDERNERYIAFLHQAKRGLFETSINTELEALRESLIRRVKELDHIVPMSELQRRYRSLLFNILRAQRRGVRKRILPLTSETENARPARMTVRASSSKRKRPRSSKRQRISAALDSQNTTVLKPKDTFLGIKLSSTSSLGAPHPIFVAQLAQRTQDNEEIADTDLGVSNGSSSQGAFNENHDGDDGREGPIIDPNSSSEGGDSSDNSSEAGSSKARQQQKEEHTPLTYQIPAETLRKAMTASLSTGAAYWRHDLYRGPQDQKISMHYCKNMEVSERVAKYFVEEKVLGFDIEWKPNASVKDGIRGNASLIQLASEDRIALFHIALFKGDTIDELLPPTIKRIMECPDITKAGVAIKGDCTRLQKHLGIQSRGMLELSHLHNLVKFSATEPTKVKKTLVSLARQVEEHLQLPLAKGDVRQSDWSKALLYDQILYAASDAYAGFRLYDVLEAKRKKLEPTPPRPEYAELNAPVRLAASFNVVAVQKVPVVPNEDSEDSEEDFETAPEDAEESDDEVETSSEDGSSDADDSSDGEFMPSTRRIGRVRLGRSHPVEPGLSGKRPQEDSASTSNDLTDGGLARLPKRVGHVRLQNPTPTTATTMPAEEAETPQDSTRPKRVTKQTPVGMAPKSAEYLRAEAWVEEWLMGRPELRKPLASASQLRAYALWHVQSLSLEDVGAHLRDVPLATSTVSSYVLTAILSEGLPFNVVRIKEPLSKLPHYVVQTRYKSILKRMKE